MRLLLLAFLCTAQSEAQSEIAGRIDLNVMAGFVTGQNLRFLLLEAPVNVNRYLSFAPAYVRIGSPSTNADQLRGSATFSLPIGRFLLDDRNLFVRHFGSSFDTTLYRNRIRLTRPFKLGRQSAALFAASEFFYDWRLQTWARTWLSAGGSFDLTRNLTALVYYLRQDNRRNPVANTVLCAILLRIPGIARIPSRLRKG